MARLYHSIEELPRTIPVFPLSSVLLLPRGQLPLNVFEPRYLAMVDTALAGPRLIGMIQPRDDTSATSLKPPLTQAGCAGKITAFQETEDGRYLITLSGICRFRVARELDAVTPYRQITADYTPYTNDLAVLNDPQLPRERLLTALKTYLTRRDLKADWDSAATAPPEALVNALAMLCPFEPAEKQALLEAPGWQERVDTLIALLELSGAESSGGKSMN